MMCSVCIVRAQRDDDDFLPCSPACFWAALRACEQRVLIAAREAVKALCHQHPLIWPTDEGAMQALDAAIDALRKEPQ